VSTVGHDQCVVQGNVSPIRRREDAPADSKPWPSNSWPSAAPSRRMAMGGGGEGGGGGVTLARTFHSLSADVHGPRTATNAAVGSTPPPLPAATDRHMRGDEASDNFNVLPSGDVMVFHFVLAPLLHSDSEHSWLFPVTQGVALTHPIKRLPGMMVPPCGADGSAYSSLTPLSACGSTQANRSSGVAPPSESACAVRTSAGVRGCVQSVSGFELLSTCWLACES
jgi:hypothetical protein